MNPVFSNSTQQQQNSILIQGLQLLRGSAQKSFTSALIISAFALLHSKPVFALGLHEETLLGDGLRLKFESQNFSKGTGAEIQFDEEFKNLVTKFWNSLITIEDLASRVKTLESDLESEKKTNLQLKEEVYMRRAEYQNYHSEKNRLVNEIEVLKKEKKMLHWKLDAEISEKEYYSKNQCPRCLTCQDRIPNVVYNCRHCVVCETCDSKIGDQCPICRVEIDSRIPIFLNQ